MKKTFVLLMLGLVLSLTACTEEKKQAELIEPAEVSESAIQVRVPRTNIQIDYQFGPSKHVVIEKVGDEATLRLQSGSAFSVKDEKIYYKGSYAVYHGVDFFISPYNDIMANLESESENDKQTTYKSTVTFGHTQHAKLTPVFWEWVDAGAEGSVDHMNFTVIVPKDNTDEICSIFSEDVNFRMTIRNLEAFTVAPNYDESKGPSKGVVKKYEKQWKRCTSL